MTRTRKDLFVAVGLATALVFGAGCSSASPKARQVAARRILTLAARPAANAPALPPLKCPIDAPNVIAKHQRAGTTSTFVPDHPVALRACRYHGYNQAQPNGSLAKSAPFAPGSFVTALNAARAVPGGVLYNCPMDANEKILLIFEYAHGGRLTASIQTMGCEFATNGDRTIWTPSATIGRLEAVLGRDHD